MIQKVVVVVYYIIFATTVAGQIVFTYIIGLNFQMNENIDSQQPKRQ